MVSNVEIINALKVTIDHNGVQKKKQMDAAVDTKQKTLIAGSFDEIIDGHFDMLKIFMFIDLVETNNLNIEHLNDLMDEHISIINNDLDAAKNDAAKKKMEYNLELWNTAKKKINGYMELLNPVD
jgi:hypothetical protein